MCDLGARLTGVEVEIISGREWKKERKEKISGKWFLGKNSSNHVLERTLNPCLRDGIDDLNEHTLPGFSFLALPILMRKWLLSYLAECVCVPICTCDKYFPQLRRECGSFWGYFSPTPRETLWWLGNCRKSNRRLLSSFPEQEQTTAALWFG